MLKIFISLGVLFSTASFAYMNEPDHIMIKPQEIKWSEGPASLPSGAKVAILFGDPSVAGPFSMRLKFPDKYKIAPHFHPQDENVTVLSGGFLMGVGDDKDGHVVALPAGGFARMKAGTHHFAQTKNETIVQINSVGPWGITYVNPDDDPRNAKIIFDRR